MHRFVRIAVVPTAIAMAAVLASTVPTLVSATLPSDPPVASPVSPATLPKILPDSSPEAPAPASSPEVSPQTSPVSLVVPSATDQASAPADTEPGITPSARTAAAPGASGCPTATPTDQSAGLTSITLSDTTVNAWQSVTLRFAGALPDTSCAGDFVTVTIPAALIIQSGSYDVLDAGGVQLGVMVVNEANRTATITFNDYVENHDNVTYHGFLTSQFFGSVDPGTPYVLTFQVGASSITVDVTTNPCEGCDDPRTAATKWASLDDDVVWFGMESAHVKAAGEVLTFTDTLGPGQELRCDSLHASVNRLDKWGSLIYVRSISFTIDPSTPCTTTGFTATVTAGASEVGMYIAMGGKSAVTDATLKEYTDEGTVTQAGVEQPVDAGAPRYSGGAGGSGDTPPQPTDPQPTDPQPTEPATVATDGPTPSSGVGGDSGTLPGGILPATGSSTMVPALVAAALLVLGSLIVGVTRRRRPTESASSAR